MLFDDMMDAGTDEELGEVVADGGDEDDEDPDVAADVAADDEDVADEDV